MHRPAPLAAMGPGTDTDIPLPSRLHKPSLDEMASQEEVPPSEADPYKPPRPLPGSAVGKGGKGGRR